MQQHRRLKALYYATGIEILKMAFKIAGNYVAANHDLLFLGLCTDLLQHKLNTTTLISTETRCDANNHQGFNLTVNCLLL